jgi:hypothetical protein
MAQEKAEYRAILAKAESSVRAAEWVLYQAECLAAGKGRLSALRQAVAEVAGSVVSLERELSLVVELAERRDIAPREL